MRGHICHATTACRALLFVALAFAQSLSIAETGDPISAKDILERIENEGGRAVIGDSEERWNDLATRIESGLNAGQPEWAEVVRRLAPSSDAGSADDLQIIVSRSLASAPRLALGLLGEHPLSPGQVCEVPFDTETKVAIKRRFLLSAEVALSGLDLGDEPWLEPKRVECLRQLRAAKCRVFGCHRRPKSG